MNNPLVDEIQALADCRSHAERADWLLKHADQFPYEEMLDDDPTTPPVDWAHRAARAIFADLTDRKGIKHELNAIDDTDIRREIVLQAAEVIRRALEEGTGS